MSHLERLYHSRVQEERSLGSGTIPLPRMHPAFSQHFLFKSREKVRKI